MEHENMQTTELANYSTQLIKDWIQHEAPFFGRTDDIFINNFLDICSYDVEKTKQRISTYYELRRLYPKLMTNRDFLDEKKMKLFNQHLFTSDVWQPDSKCPVVTVIKVSRLERGDDLIDALHLLLIGGESGLLDSARCRQYGIISILDLGDMLFSHILQVTPSFIIQIFKCLLEGLPVKLREIHCINVGSIVKAAITVGILVLQAEIRKIIHIHSGSWECIHDRVPAECLPNEYGGTNGTLEYNNEAIEGMFTRWRDYLLDDEKYGYNNALE